jgi:hypothetical protein
MGFVHPRRAVAQETMEKLTCYVFEGTCHSEASVQGGHYSLHIFQYTFRQPVRRKHGLFLGVRIFFINIPLCTADYASCLYVRHVDPVATGVAFMPGQLAGVEFLLRCAIEYLPESEKRIVKGFSFDCTDGSELCISGEFMEFERHADGIWKRDGLRAKQVVY